MVRFRLFTIGKPNTDPDILVTFIYFGVRVVTSIPDSIQRIHVPTMDATGMVDHVYTRRDECLPAGDGLAIVFEIEGGSSHG